MSKESSGLPVEWDALCNSALVWFLTPGWIYDWMHSYDLAFYFSGSFMLLGGAGLFLSALSCWDKNQDKTNTPDTEYTNDYDKVATVAWSMNTRLTAVQKINSLTLCNNKKAEASEHVSWMLLLSMLNWRILENEERTVLRLVALF